MHISQIQGTIEAVSDQVNGRFQKNGALLRQHFSGSTGRFGSWVLTLFAIQIRAEKLLTPTGREHPRAVSEGRLVSDMLAMTTGQFSNPVAMLILVVPDDRLLHVVGTYTVDR